MSGFIHEDFMLGNGTARELYHGVAERLPILDYHNHLPPAEIAQDKRWGDITEVWLGKDHYKWRAMRANGVPERVITGEADPAERFAAWAATVPATLRNPLYHWTHLELKRYFGVDELLSPATADSIRQACNERLADPAMSCRGLLRQSNVTLACTTDDPIDNLEHHAACAADPSFTVRVLPTFRPDVVLAVERTATWNQYLEKLGEAADVQILSLDDLLTALDKRHAFFHERGCRLSDNGLETIYSDDYTRADMARLFERLRSGAAPRMLEAHAFKSMLLHELALMHHARGWTQQYHFGALRNVSSRILARLGPDSGGDTIADGSIGHALARFLDDLDRKDRLARTILYNLNPRDNALMAAMAGSFNDGSEPGKIQWGSGWWFLDQKQGMEEQLETLSQIGLLSRFVGMLTDSRSFLSFTRHEYFRRILCNMIGADAESGLLPGDMGLLGGLVRDICHDNAARYFKFTGIETYREAGTR